MGATVLQRESKVEKRDWWSDRRSHACDFAFQPWSMFELQLDRFETINE